MYLHLGGVELVDLTFLNANTVWPLKIVSIGRLLSVRDVAVRFMAKVGAVGEGREVLC